MKEKKVLLRLLPWALSFFLLLSMVGFSFLKRSKPIGVQESQAPDLKLCARCEAIGVVPNRWNLKGHTLAKNIYDGDETTVFCDAKTQVITLDLGGLHMVSGVRFLPCEGERESDIDRAQGMVFYLSKDNRNFQKAGTAEPKDNLGYEQQWQEYLFDGVGEFRYVRLEIPAGARIAEAEWLAYPDWQYQAGRRYGETQWQMQLYAYDAQRELDTKVLTGVYTANGVLKALSVNEERFSPEADRLTALQLAVPNHQKGDKYRVMVWEQDGTSALARDLHFCYSQGGLGFSVPNLFSNAMLLQADKPLTVWGTAPADSKIHLSLQSQDGTEYFGEAVAGSDCEWEADLGVFPPGGNYTLTIACDGERKIFKDITFGDIWLCVGQSNMDYHLLGGQDTIKYLESEQGKRETNNPEIRLLNLWAKGIGGAGAPVINLPVGYANPAWSMMNHEAASYCSAIGYFFAQKIQQEMQIPVGIINAAVGDTEINRWIPYGTQLGSFTSSDGGLFYNRILPFAKLQIKGILMYQGEADEYRTHMSTPMYRDALSGLVDLYREIWGEELPFYWTQLTRYKKDESLVREGQRLALAQIKNPNYAGVISLMDIYGEYEGGVGNCREDIHPHQKQVVAERFFRYAMRDVYGKKNIVASGPVYQSMEQQGNHLVLHFLTHGDLRVLPKEQYADKQGRKWIKNNNIDENQPQCFEIAGADGVFYSAKAEIQGDTIRVWSNQVLEPVMARYAWGAYPEMPNLTDASMLPALSFCAP